MEDFVVGSQGEKISQEHGKGFTYREQQSMLLKYKQEHLEYKK